jgi:hypothetical protein
MWPLLLLLLLLCRYRPEEHPLPAHCVQRGTQAGGQPGQQLGFSGGGALYPGQSTAGCGAWIWGKGMCIRESVIDTCFLRVRCDVGVLSSISYDSHAMV